MEIVFCKVENSTAQNLLAQSFQNIDKKISRILKREENRNERFHSSHQVKLKSYVNGGEYVR